MVAPWLRRPLSHVRAVNETPRYRLALDLGVPALVVLLPLEGPCEVQFVGSRTSGEATWGEVERLRDFVEENDLRSALVFAAFALKDLGVWGTIEPASDEGEFDL